MKKNKQCSSGFTLIEVLLGLSIFSIIALTAYSVFSAGIKLNRGAENQGQVLREARWMLELMQNEFENMLFYDYSSTYEGKTALSGTDNSISFIKSSPTGLKVVKYYLVSADDSKVHQVLKGNTYSKNVSVLLENEKGGDTDCLIREESSFIDDLSGNSSDNEFEIIAKNIKKNGLRFFFGYLEGKIGDEIKWQEIWNDNYIASMIRVEFDLISGHDDRVITLTKDIFIPTGDLRYEEIEKKKVKYLFGNQNE
ncbi:MAG: prepilin-type N-terminal cleavage/methylation domain-containing protein [Candidatus Omnitrophica bacterium]|nr:prepilin-type N-terminal cleavage/methylation domain-containing protein [Candidatus Omnitrophota bacterium]MBU1996516.1 prepilin-type N-terminal cleavage/methylation domain-containing protein [Candidatus Omnitrophota bacterium]MBU4333065.1 prepilin-type N-terminal cleavage/methylation domain-containing protein [Candidatus Omnitrophota bacterium]